MKKRVPKNKLYRSGLEEKATTLLTKHKVEFEYEPKDKKLNYIIPESKHTYLPDVIIDGKILEFKGYFDLNDRKKIKLIVEQHPDLDLTMVFQKNQPIRKGSKTLYGDWCDKNGIKWMLYSDFEKLIKTKTKK